MRSILEDMLTSAFQPVYAIDVRNISNPRDKEDSFAIEIVSPKFEGMSTSKRYTAVGDIVHANTDGRIVLLQLSCKTPNEAR